MKLYELSQEYLKALDFLTDPENEIDDQTAIDTMEGLQGGVEDKLLNVARVIMTIEAEAEAMKAVAKRQADRAKTAQNRADGLRKYLLGNMQSTGLDKASASDILISIAKTPASVKVIDEGLIPAEFLRHKIETVPDKAAIKEAGGCAGCVVETGYRVSIR